MNYQVNLCLTDAGLLELTDSHQVVVVEVSDSIYTPLLPVKPSHHIMQLIACCILVT